RLELSKFADADPFGVCAAGVVMRTVMTSSYKDRQKPAAPFTSMPKKDFGRCDGHHEMDDFHARKKRSAPGLGAAFSFKRKTRACRGRSADCRLLRPRRQRPRRRAAGAQIPLRRAAGSDGKAPRAAAGRAGPRARPRCRLRKAADAVLRC